MKTKITLREKTLYEKVKEVVDERAFVEMKHNEITIIFEKTLTATQIQKIKDKLENRCHVQTEEVEESVGDL